MRLAAPIDENVPRFQIAVNDAIQMRGADRLCDPGEQSQSSCSLCSARRLRPPPRRISGLTPRTFDITVQRLPIDIIHHEVKMPRRHTAVDDSDNVGMIETGENVNL